MKITRDNCFIEQEKDAYYRVNIVIETHLLHSEKLNLNTAIHMRDKLIENEKSN